MCDVINKRPLITVLNLLNLICRNIKPETVFIVIAYDGKLLTWFDVRSSYRIVNGLHPMIAPRLKQEDIQILYYNESTQNGT